MYISLEARSCGKSVFKRMVQCPEVFEYDSFVRVMRSIFGEKVVIEFLIV